MLYPSCPAPPALPLLLYPPCSTPPALPLMLCPSCSAPAHYCLTIKVDVSVFVEVDVGEDLFQLAFLQFLPQEALHALLQLFNGDLPIAVTVKLKTDQSLWSDVTTT